MKSHNLVFLGPFVLISFLVKIVIVSAMLKGAHDNEALSLCVWSPCCISAEQRGPKKKKEKTKKKQKKETFTSFSFLF